jgi:hypothetical protein
MIKARRCGVAAAINRSSSPGAVAGRDRLRSGVQTNHVYAMTLERRVVAITLRDSPIEEMADAGLESIQGHAQDDERSTPCHAPRALGYVPGLRTSQEFALEDVVRNVDAHEQPRVERHRGGREPGARDPGGGKGRERHHVEVDEVNPDKTQRGRTHEPHQIVVVDPDDGDKQ